MTNFLRASRPRVPRPLRGAASFALLLGAGTLAVAASPARVAPPADWPELRGDTSRRGVTEEKVSPPLSLLWRFTSGPQSPNPVSPSVVNGTVYFAARGTSESPGGIVFALDTKTGQRKWQYPNDNNGLRDRNVFQTAPLVNNGRVYIGASDGLMYVLDANNGREILRFRTGRQIVSSPALVDDVLYFGSNDGRFYALKPETGEPAWKQLYNAGDGINSAPVFANNLVYFTTNDNTLHAVNQSSGAGRWRTRLPNRVLSNAPIFADNSLFVASGPALYAIQPVGGQNRWVYGLPTDILTAPVAEGGVIYVTCRERTGSGALMYALRTQNGRDVWAKPAVLPYAPSAAPIISGDIIYLPTAKNVVMAVSREDGKVLWSYTAQSTPRSNSAAPSGGGGGSSNPFGYGGGSSSAAGGPGGGSGASGGSSGPAQAIVFSTPLSIADNTLYAVSDDGTLSAFRPDAPDTTGPELAVTYPAPAQAVSGQPPLTIAASAIDMGTGLNPDSISVKLDGQPVGANFDANQNLIYYQTKATGKIVDRPLENGRHTVTVTATDWRGNSSEQTWSFVVNNALPPASSTREAPRIRNTPTRPTAPGTNTPGAGGRGNRGGRGSGAGGGRPGGGL